MGLPAPRVVTVLTFNIHHGEGTDGELDIDRIARVIRSAGADIVGIQEADRHYGQRSRWLDEAAQLGQRLRMHTVFGPNIDDAPPGPGRQRMQYGNALLSRFPVLSWSNAELPGRPDDEPRGLLHAVLEVDGVTVQACSTHLALSAADRTAQVRRIEELLGRTEDPVVLTGDMNATPDAPEIKALGVFLTDAWEAAGPGHTIGSCAPSKRIDYVLARDLRPLTARVITTDPAASDHLPVAATLLLGPV